MWISQPSVSISWECSYPRFNSCRSPYSGPTSDSVVVPSDALVSETTIEDVDVCDESVTEVDLPVVSSAALVSVSDETKRGAWMFVKSL